MTTAPVLSSDKTQTHQSMTTLTTKPAQRIRLDVFAQFLQGYVPVKADDVPFWWHLPRNSGFDTSTAAVRRAIFSITPTAGVYDAFERRTAATPRPFGVSVAFIHRPWALDRRRCARARGTVLASHKSLDEVLTTGWNVQLARRLDVDVMRSVCIQGYKDDPERRIGLVGPVSTVVTEGVLLHVIQKEFGALEGCFGFSDSAATEQDILHGMSDRPIRAIAIMNAFNTDEVDRAANAAVEAGFIAEAANCSELLYLTGQPRQQGVDAAAVKGMRVVCVGHKSCESWGLRFLAAQTRAQFPGLEVIEIDEPEEIQERVAKPETAVLPTA